MTDELGTRSETVYDAAGRVTKTIADVGVGRLNAESVTVYDKAGRVIEERDALGHATHYEYDRVGRLTATVGPNGQRSTTEYDEIGRVVAMVDALGHRTEFALDANGNQVSETDALGHITRTEYDALDRQIATVDANSVRRSTVYDAIGQVTGVRDGRGYLTQMSYDQVGQRLSVMDAKGHVTSYVYNERGELTQERDPLGRSTFNDYDDAGRRISSTDAKNQTTQWSYDKVGRVTRSQFADNTSIAYLYDAAGNLIQMSDSLGVTLYGYDALNRDTGVFYGSGHQLTYALDVAGRRTGMTDPDGGETTYVYDNSDRLTQLTNPQNEITLFSYDALDRVMKKTLANGVIETHTFDAAGRETKVEQRDSSGALLSSFVSVYDRVNQRTSVTEAGGSATTYAYDDDGQLLSETRTGAHPYSIAYAYDEVGNRTSKVEGDLTTSYVYDVANQLLSQETRDSSHVVVSQSATTYDANGNVTQQVEDGQTTAFVWNPQNYLMSVSASDGSSETYAYCGEGIRRTVSNSDGLRRFIRDGQNILLEADGNGATMRRYTHMGESWGALLLLREGSASRYYGFDGSANTRVLTDGSGAVSDVYLYSAFGKELEVSGNSANPLRFGGEVGYYRDDIERVYVRARHLDVGAGRWMSRDPIGFVSGNFNVCNYMGNKAVNFIDPSGLWERKLHKDMTNDIASRTYLKVNGSWITFMFPSEIGNGADIQDSPVNSAARSANWFKHFNYCEERGDLNRVKKALPLNDKNDTRVVYYNSQLEEAIYLSKQALDYSKDNTIYAANRCRLAMNEFGMGLHGIEDIYSHRSLTPAEHRDVANSKYVDNPNYIITGVKEIRPLKADYPFIKNYFDSFSHVKDSVKVRVFSWRYDPKRTYLNQAKNRVAWEMCQFLKELSSTPCVRRVSWQEASKGHKCN